ncbi:DNA-processing protein DprA [Candidatus Magnetominusculus xianensis]|uniref:Smf/DprA SLOG domain-containing protein n=1 Tax=Candidatus Magnetominusculus xianensis TaxID=1748249 RepID=A0ABR5SIC7_9BACT|nr:DNA-processing protein DprA [Candidatus Magnetominusculus xianensis]KWT92177.1 hypothetical protein ASN18_0581 [Candidatus Magnetominusculus xianensis]MBF0404652.1 DNA-processing protein DprA [Nitrospirota bacterium]
MIYQNTLGNREILNHHKIAFLCSRRCPSVVILKTYDWAIEQRDKGNCVMSGFHSVIEKDVFHYLLKGSQPMIMVLARGMIKLIKPEIQNALDNGRLLIISPFNDSVTRPTSDTAATRNRIMADIADEIMVAHAEHEGKLEKLIKEIALTGKKIRILGNSE